MTVWLVEIRMGPLSLDPDKRVKMEAKIKTMLPGDWIIISDDKEFGVIARLSHQDMFMAGVAVGSVLLDAWRRVNPLFAAPGPVTFDVTRAARLVCDCGERACIDCGDRRQCDPEAH